MKENLVITVNNNDESLGLLDKLEAHKRGVLHRAVSVLAFNSKGEWLLQKRNPNKYHSGALWSNSACSHPYEEERNLACAERRLFEEMGMYCDLEKSFDFIYKEKLDNGLIEHEFDHVFIGTTDNIPVVNVDEVVEFKYISTPELLKELNEKPHEFSSWFKLIVPLFLELK
jgi:isopentenyl-diphosphate delta-isomerase